jgi:hypothetical protein
MAIAKANTPAARQAPAPPRAMPKATPPASAGGSYMSLDPDTFTAGGLIDDIDVEFTDVLACEYDYGGNAPLGPSLAIEMTDVNGQAHVQYYSAGKAEDWKPSDDGCGFVPVSGKTGFNNNSNISMLLASMVAADPRVKPLLAAGNVKALIGTKAHVLQKQLERKGLVRTGRNADRAPSVLLVTKIMALPGDEGTGTGAARTTAAAGGKPNGQAAAQSKAAAATEAAADTDTTIIDALSQVLMGASEVAGVTLTAEGALAKKDVAKVVFQAFPVPPNTPQQRNAAVVRSGQQEFLKGLAEYGIAYSGTDIRMATEGATQ